MRAIISIVKIITMLFLVGALTYFALKNVPFVNEAKWNPLTSNAQQYVDEEGYVVPLEGQKYILEDNEILRNVPSSQARQFFNWIDKHEFMQVNDFTRMGYDNEYLIAQRDTQYIMYKFGSKKVRVYTTEHDLYFDLNREGHQIEMSPLSSFN
ncbi:DUF4930 family protein [Staphylococcus ratti]|uniref:DUF4930 family protein n=1 Tax=Staphylococcus ratti TaxID=2892440 RepID=A0ABY3PFG2_9STAP|nr:DUF4930 family protein [Staphylococcus ratti]UEX91014.1 DUF4930 family protein [Staphylococcus ratti]